MANTTIESGKGDGYTARVDSPGGLQTTPSPLSVATFQQNIGVLGGSVVSARTGRRQIQIQKLDAVNPLHIRLAAAIPTVNDVMIPAGGMYEFPPGVCYEGEIDGLGPAGAVQVVAVEFYA